ncbi:MAG TPA: class I SAM-dependent methyltransferase [Allosphingosinicella sp.]|jgi:SAM-dependent methyltransferase
MPSDWDRSAEAWLSAMSDEGDWARAAVLDNIMLKRASLAAPARVLDVGCGEGRFCRLLERPGRTMVGIDPTNALIEAARRRHPGGDYRIAGAENLPFADGSFDLVVSYLSLIDIERLAEAAAEMTRVLAPGGKLLLANLASHNSAGRWLKDEAGGPVGYLIDRYLEERPVRQQWQGIDIVNWHRPLSTYMRLFLENWLRLTYFDEPAPAGGEDPTGGKFIRAPWFVVMEWQKG